MQSTVLLGAFNHFNTKGFVEFLDGLEWERASTVQLLAKEEHEEIFRFIWAPLEGRAENHLKTCHTAEYPGCDPRCRRGADPMEWVEGKKR